MRGDPAVIIPAFTILLYDLQISSSRWMLSLVQSVKEKGSVQDHGPWLMVFENSRDYTVLVDQYQGMWEFFRVGSGGG